MSLETFMRNFTAQQQREADDIANSVKYTLEEALAYNKAKIKTNRQSTLQLKTGMHRATTCVAMACTTASMAALRDVNTAQLNNKGPTHSRVFYFG